MHQTEKCNFFSGNLDFWDAPTIPNPVLFPGDLTFDTLRWTVGRLEPLPETDQSHSVLISSVRWGISQLTTQIAHPDRSGFIFDTSKVLAYELFSGGKAFKKTSRVESIDFWRLVQDSPSVNMRYLLMNFHVCFTEIVNTFRIGYTICIILYIYIFVYWGCSATAGAVGGRPCCR